MESPSLDEFTAATYNIARGTQRRMDAAIGDIMKLHNALWGSEGRHERRRHLVVGLHECGNWAGCIQPKTHKHFRFYGQPGKSDCGFIFPSDLVKEIIKVCWGSRFFIVATASTIFVSMHLVWTEEAADTIEQIHYEIQNIQLAFPKCSEMIFAATVMCPFGETLRRIARGCSLRAHLFWRHTTHIGIVKNSLQC